MKLYLSSIEIPTPSDLAQLLSRPLNETTIALIPNAQDYYAERARSYQINTRITNLKALGFNVMTVDLRDFNDTEALKTRLEDCDLVWAMGGNTYILRFEMHRSGFDDAIKGLLENGIIYCGDSAGALIAGKSIGGIESADPPEFAEVVIEAGLQLVPYVILPHVDNPEFADVLPIVRNMHQGKTDLIELKDSQAVIFDNTSYHIVSA